MSSRSPSYERETSKKSHKHKKRRHKSRSYSPRERELSDKPAESFGKWESDEETKPRRHKKHKKHHHSSDEEDYRSGRVKEEPRDNHHGNRIKRERHDRGYERSRSDDRRHQREERERNNDRRRDNYHRRGGERGRNFLNDGDSGEFGPANAGQTEPPKDKEKPNFELSGKLTEDTNTFRGVVIKYSEPPEARKPKKRWRLYPFKGDQALPVLHIHRQSAYLLGRDRLVVDIPVDHPSCSKQHAALQYRLVEYDRPDGRVGRQVRPYIIDLESANGTFLNNTKIEPRKYHELMEKDVVKFGFSSREYVILHDKVDISEIEDDEGAD